MTTPNHTRAAAFEDLRHQTTIALDIIDPAALDPTLGDMLGTLKETNRQAFVPDITHEKEVHLTPEQLRSDGVMVLPMLSPTESIAVPYGAQLPTPRRIAATAEMLSINPDECRQALAALHANVRKKDPLLCQTAVSTPVTVTHASYALPLSNVVPSIELISRPAIVIAPHITNQSPVERTAALLQGYVLAAAAETDYPPAPQTDAERRKERYYRALLKAQHVGSAVLQFGIIEGKNEPGPGATLTHSIEGMRVSMANPKDPFAPTPELAARLNALGFGPHEIVRPVGV